jgi:hypothetical protein
MHERVYLSIFVMVVVEEGAKDEGCRTCGGEWFVVLLRLVVFVF